MGKLIPVGIYEVLPGDSVQQASSALIRVSPLVAPVMHPVIVRIHHWFVPNRIVWDGWEDFITGGADGLGGASGAYPTVSSPTGWPAGELPDYFGIKPGIASVVSAMPFRAYNLIYNEFYRDQDLSGAAAISTGSGDDTVTRMGAPLFCAWEKDYFTSARPWPQKGADVSLPLGVSAPVVPAGGPANNAPTFQESGGHTPTALGFNVGSGNAIWMTGNQSIAGSAKWVDPGLIADLTNATATNVNDVRRAFALQRYQEARAMYGSRYTEYLRYLGVRSSDARLQRPEYLGGGRQVVSFSEVLQTGPSVSAGESVGGVGDLKGHGIAAMRSRRWRRFFEEHGHVISLMSVRPRSMYMDGQHKLWNRRTKEDYWQRELEHIGQQEVLNKEVFKAGDATDDGIFGYQDRYAEYRHLPSLVSAEFRSILDYWHMARSFASMPALNASFVECDPTKRIHAEQTQNSLWCMVNNNIQARRMVGRPGVPRIF
jgi:hypothetical protein